MPVFTYTRITRILNDKLEESISRDQALDFFIQYFGPQGREMLSEAEHEALQNPHKLHHEKLTHGSIRIRVIA